MQISENSLKWLMRLYPPFLIQRIWVTKIYKNFSGIDVKINRSLITSNLGKATFGGTIFSATDPFYAMLFGQLMMRKGFRITVWLKSAQIQYIKPAVKDLYFSIRITEDMITEAETLLKEKGKYIKSLPIEVYNKQGELCVTALNEVYIRNLDFKRQ